MAAAAAAVVGVLHVLNHFFDAAGTGAPTVARFERVEGNPAFRLDRSTGLRQSARRSCVPDPAPAGTELVCGISPPSRRVHGGTAYRLVTVSGERFRVVLPDTLSRGGRVVAVPQTPIGWLGGPEGSEVHVSTAPPADAVARLCGAARACRPAAVEQRTLSNGTIHTRWDLGGPRPEDHAATMQMGTWVLTFSGPATEITEFVAGILRWRLDRGFLLLESPDPTYPVYADWAGVRMVVAGGDEPYEVAILPGCDLSEKRPAAGREDADRRLRLGRDGPHLLGEWCARGGFWVRAAAVDERTLRRLHEGLAVRRP